MATTAPNRLRKARQKALRKNPPKQAQLQPPNRRFFIGETVVLGIVQRPNQKQELTDRAPFWCIPYDRTAFAHRETDG